jgi:uncharacterized lipoprotein
VRRNISALLAVLITASLLGGCGFLHRTLDRKDNTYKQSTEQRPLEVPPDLDTPSSSSALVIPAPSATPASDAAPAAAAAAPESVDTPPAQAAPPALAASPDVSIDGGGLLVPDSPDSTWTRVGLAMERSGAARIVQRDQAAHAYTVETTGQTTVKPGWFKRAITFGQAGNKVTAKVQLTVRVVADGAGSRLSVEGAADEASRDAARALLQTLRERLT